MTERETRRVRRDGHLETDEAGWTTISYGCLCLLIYFNLFIYFRREFHISNIIDIQSYAYTNKIKLNTIQIK